MDPQNLIENWVAISTHHEIIFLVLNQQESISIRDLSRFTKPNLAKGWVLLVFFREPNCIQLCQVTMPGAAILHLILQGVIGILPQSDNRYFFDRYPQISTKEKDDCSARQLQILDNCISITHLYLGDNSGLIGERWQKSGHHLMRLTNV